MAQARTLQNLCNVFESLDLPLNLEINAAGDWPHQFFSYDGAALAGVLTLQAGPDVEICLAVHPARRRRGIGRRLLDAAVEACRARGMAEALLVCEAASRSGRAFVSATGATYRNAEYRLRLDRVPEAGTGRGANVPATARGLRLQPARVADLEVLASIVAGAFGHPVEAERRRLAADLELPTHRFFIARDLGRPIGSVGVVTAGPRAYVIAMGVVPESRGHGYGRMMLETVLAMLLAEGQTEIFIEVDAENVAALSLYRSCGFRETTRYEFFRLAIQ
ncbi:MAG: GNAT family N-acetyltransferase [Armatimonadota bacterium]|nr:GNAT family N-acetyltransferase [Armatimonadota bacterium]